MFIRFLAQVTGFESP